MDLCLAERSLPCRSIVYDYSSRTCNIFSETRRSRPKSFVAAHSRLIDYAENLCVSEPSTCQYRDYAESFFPYVDRLTSAASLADCQRQCDAERLFPCRSVNFETYVHDCALSSEDQVSMAHLIALGHAAVASKSGANGGTGMIVHKRHKSIYSEKGNCEQGTC